MEAIIITNIKVGSVEKRKYVVIVQPYVPKYRESFFTGLIAFLDDAGVDCRVAAAAPNKDQAARGDAVDADWVIPYFPRQLRIAGRTIGLGGARPLWAKADVVVIGHLGSSLDTYLAIADAKMGRTKVGLWGHIKSYVTVGNPLDLALERWQLRVADHIFAYSPGGRDYAISSGVSSDKITTVMNATDTKSLIHARDAIKQHEVEHFMVEYGLPFGRTLGFIGGLDSSKRIEFLAAVLEQLWVSDPDVRLLVGGMGVQAGLLQPAVARGQVVMLGYVDSKRQAMIGRVVSGLAMPGRIGLVAVDALVLGVPILTTNWSYHAPEAEFLSEGESRFTSANNVHDYVTLVRNFLNLHNTEKLFANRNKWKNPTLDAMITNFGQGILQMLDLEKN